MNSLKLTQKIILLLLTGICAKGLQAQVDIKGTVYDRSIRIALQGVSVLSSSGRATITDSKGNYHIKLTAEDSVYFSYLGKRTSPIPVSQIEFPLQFDMSLEVAVDSLLPVSVWSRNYREDSLENRAEYKKIFEYGGPDICSSPPAGQNVAPGMGLDLDLLFNARKQRRLEAFQKRLIEDEQYKYVSHRFTKSLVVKITGLRSPELDSFMREYRPSYDFIQACSNEYEFYKYIRESRKFFEIYWKENHG